MAVRETRRKKEWDERTRRGVDGIEGEEVQMDRKTRRKRGDMQRQTRVLSMQALGSAYRRLDKEIVTSYQVTVSSIALLFLQISICLIYNMNSIILLTLCSLQKYESFYRRSLRSR